VRFQKFKTQEWHRFYILRKCTLPGCLQVSHHDALLFPCEDTIMPLLQNSL
jgi:hypothetical protein